MSADFIAYGEGEWCPSFSVINPDGTTEKRRLRFDVEEGAKIYFDPAVYKDVVAERAIADRFISQERLNELWDDA